MNLRTLQTFQVVAEELNFSRAAIKLNYSQPTVSKHIQSLENELNVMLFTRKDGQYHLTEAGIKLYNHSLNIKREMDSISKLSLHGEEFFPLKLQGHDYYCYKYFLPAINKMRSVYPGVHFELYASNNKDTINSLLKNEIDVGIVSGSVLPKSFESIQVGFEEVGICVGKDIYREGLTTEDYIKKYPILIDESDYYQSANIFPYVTQALDVINTNSDETVQEGILQHNCVGVVRTGRLKEDILKENIHVIETVVRQDPVYIVVNKENMNEARISTFFELLIEYSNPKNKYKMTWI